MGKKDAFSLQNLLSGYLGLWSYKWGACIPSACTGQDVADTLNAVLSFAGPIIPNTDTYLKVVPAGNPDGGDTALTYRPTFQAGSIVFM